MHAESDPPTTPPRRVGFRWFRLAGAMIVVGVTSACVLYYVAPLFVEVPSGIAGIEGAAAPRGLRYLDREGRSVRHRLDGDLRADEPARFEEFPEVLIAATLAAEDSRYFSHGGVDFRGTLRALRDTARRGRRVSGASTITQQTVKLYAPPRPRNLRTKVAEILAARKLEIFLDKETILTAYLNRLPYGNQYTGARAAAQGYFGKPLSDLSLAEASLLAGLPNRPSRLNPWRNPEGARQRQRWILQRLEDTGRIGPERREAALAERLRYLPGPAQTFRAPHFVELLDRLEADAVARAREAGLPVRTTLDLELQEFVESAAQAELVLLAHESSDRDELHAAVVVIDNRAGEVLALTGSRSYQSRQGGQINGAWAPRSAGSTLKPFTYYLALAQGYTAASILADTPVEYVTSTGAYRPVNFERRFQGPVTLRRALSNSLNVPAVKLLAEIGGPATLHGFLAESLGFTSLDRGPEDYGLGLTLGNAEVRLFELTRAYATLARLGTPVPARLVREGGEAGPLSPTEADALPLLDPAVAWLLADILSDEVARAETFGTRSPLDLPFRAAVKTGTSTDFRDSWTVGYTPDFTVGVWVGRFNNRPLKRLSGALGAAPIYHRVMVRLHRDAVPRWYDKPAGAVEAEIDPINGRIPLEGAALPPERTRSEVFVNGVLAPSAAGSDYDPKGRTLLPTGYRAWWHQGGSERLGAIAALASVGPGGSRPAFRIVSPLEGTRAFLDPDLPSGGARFPLEIAGSGEEDIEWGSPTLEIRTEGDRQWVVLEEGEHIVTARDRRSGFKVSTRFTVERL